VARTAIAGEKLSSAASVRVLTDRFSRLRSSA
jgi:hypothetical protein